MSDKHKLTLAECYEDYACGKLHKKRGQSHLNALIGNKPDGTVIIRRHLLNEANEIGFTIHLRIPNQADITMPQRVELRDEAYSLLKKHGIVPKYQAYLDPVEEHITNDIAHQNSLDRRTRIKVDEATRYNAAKQHFENRIDMFFRISASDLDKLAQVVTELEAMSVNRGRAR